MESRSGEASQKELKVGDDEVKLLTLIGSIPEGIESW